jgi:hypothetical protein
LVNDCANICSASVLDQVIHVCRRWKGQGIPRASDVDKRSIDFSSQSQRAVDAQVSQPQVEIANFKPDIRHFVFLKIDKVFGRAIGVKVLVTGRTSRPAD